MKEIEITRGQVALVDDEDYETLAQYRWQALPARGNARAGYYAKRAEGSRTILMHRQVLGVLDDPSVMVDHINGNGLDNRRANLRRATHSLNSRNRVGKNTYLGVSRDRASKARPWRAHITWQGKVYALGSYPNELEAAVAYDAAVRYLGVEGGRLNLPHITVSLPVATGGAYPSRWLSV